MNFEPQRTHLLRHSTRHEVTPAPVSAVFLNRFDRDFPGGRPTKDFLPGRSDYFSAFEESRSGSKSPAKRPCRGRISFLLFFLPGLASASFVNERGIVEQCFDFRIRSIGGVRHPDSASIHPHRVNTGLSFRGMIVAMARAVRW